VSNDPTGINAPVRRKPRKSVWILIGVLYMIICVGAIKDWPSKISVYISHRSAQIACGEVPTNAQSSFDGHPSILMTSLTGDIQDRTANEIAQEIRDRTHFNVLKTCQTVKFNPNQDVSGQTQQLEPQALDILKQFHTDVVIWGELTNLDNSPEIAISPRCAGGLQGGSDSDKFYKIMPNTVDAFINNALVITTGNAIICEKPAPDDKNRAVVYANNANKLLGIISLLKSKNDVFSADDVIIGYAERGRLLLNAVELDEKNPCSDHTTTCQARQTDWISNSVDALSMAYQILDIDPSELSTEREKERHQGFSMSNWRGWYSEALVEKARITHDLAAATLASKMRFDDFIEQYRNINVDGAHLGEYSNYAAEAYDLKFTIGGSENDKKMSLAFACQTVIFIREFRAALLNLKEQNRVIPWPYQPDKITVPDNFASATILKGAGVNSETIFDSSPGADPAWCDRQIIVDTLRRKG
jgi:hypothetical protein